MILFFFSGCLTSTVDDGYDLFRSLIDVCSGPSGATISSILRDNIFTSSYLAQRDDWDQHCLARTESRNFCQEAQGLDRSRCGDLICRLVSG